MCMDPVTGAGLALSGAGLIANTQASRQVNRARNNAAANEAARQEDFRARAVARMQQTLGDYDNPQGAASLAGQQDEAKADFRGVLRGLAPDAIPLSASAPEELRAALTTTQDRVSQQGEAAALARAMFEGYGALSDEQRRRLAAAGVDLSTLGSFAAGSSRAYGAELDSANRRGDRLGAWGNLLGQVGGLTTLAGMTGVFGGGGAGAGSGGAPLSVPNGGYGNVRMMRDPLTGRVIGGI